MGKGDKRTPVPCLNHKSRFLWHFPAISVFLLLCFVSYLSRVPFLVCVCVFLPKGFSHGSEKVGCAEDMSPGWTNLPWGVACSLGAHFDPWAAFGSLLDLKSSFQVSHLDKDWAQLLSVFPPPGGACFLSPAALPWALCGFLLWTVFTSPPKSSSYQLSFHGVSKETESQRHSKTFSGWRKGVSIWTKGVKDQIFLPSRRETLMVGTRDEIIKLDCSTIRHWSKIIFVQWQRKMEMNLALMSRLWCSPMEK